MPELALTRGKGSFRYGEETIRFDVRRQPTRKVRRIAIHIEPGGNVLVDAPVSASDPDILAAVKKRARWIHAQVARIHQRRAHLLPREYVSGESVIYLGRRYRLKVIVADDETATVRLRGGYLEVRSPDSAPQAVRTTLEMWFRARARVILVERLEAAVATLHWLRACPPIRLQAMKVQWGSCSPAGRLTLNPWLVKAPRECIDYVILHELCHLKEHNHSPRFYKLLDRYQPRWRERKLRLDELAEQILNQ